MMLMDEMEVLRRKFDALRAEIKGDTEDMKDERGVGGLEYHKSKTLEDIAEYHSQMDYLLARASSSNSTLVSDSDREDILPYS